MPVGADFGAHRLAGIAARPGARDAADATGGRRDMRDYQRDPLQRPTTDAPLPAARDHAPEAVPERAVTPGLHPGLDTASVMHLQRTAGNQGVVQMLAGEEERSPVHDVVGSGGTPLDAGTRSTMESAFGQSFSGVRVQ